MRFLSAFFVLMLFACTHAYSADIAFYVGEPNVDGWYTAAAMKDDVATIKAEVGNMFQVVAEFDDAKLKDFAQWAVDRQMTGSLTSFGSMAVSQVRSIHSRT